MNPSQPSSRRRRLSLGAEALESRALLTGGAGNTFAIEPETIAAPGGTVDVNFTLDPAHFTRPAGKMSLGIDVAPVQGSTVNPFIASVTDPHNAAVPQAIHSVYNPHLPQIAVARGFGSSAVLSPISSYPGQPDKPVTYTVNLKALGKTSGAFLLGFYLPGDANGDGKVDPTDINLVRQALGSKAGDSKYNFDADANRDGRIGMIDLAYAKINQGVGTTISPSLSADLDPASVVSGRTSFHPEAHFTGQATPGATITYSDTSKKLHDVTATADASGNYSLTVPLSAGANTFKVTSADAFGQTITGTISPVYYAPLMAQSQPDNSET